MMGQCMHTLQGVLDMEGVTPPPHTHLCLLECQRTLRLRHSPLVRALGGGQRVTQAVIRWVGAGGAEGGSMWGRYEREHGWGRG